MHSYKEIEKEKRNKQTRKKKENNMQLCILNCKTRKRKYEIHIKTMKNEKKKMNAALLKLLMLQKKKIVDVKS